jgi:hypothetical protein
MSRVLDSAYTCPRCGTDRGNTPRDLPCPNCELTLEEALAVTKLSEMLRPTAAPRPQLMEPERPPWLVRLNGFVPMVQEHDNVAARLERARAILARRQHQRPSPPILDRLVDLIERLASRKGRLIAELGTAGLRPGEIQRVRRLIEAPGQSGDTSRAAHPPHRRGAST